MKKLNKKIKKEIRESALSFLKQYNYIRLAIHKNLEDFIIFDFNNRIDNEDDYIYQVIINNKTQNIKLKELKERLKDFLDNLYLKNTY